MLPIDRAWVVSYSTSVDLIIVTDTVFEIFNIHDLELGGFEVIRGQSSEPIKSPHLIKHLMSFESNIISFTVFEIFEVKVLRPRSRTVQGRSRSNFIMPIDTPWVVFCSTSIDPVIVVSVTVFEIFHLKFSWLWTRRVQLQGHPRSKFIVPIDSPLLISYMTSFESNIWH